MATYHCVAMTHCLHVLSCYIKSNHDDIIGNNDAPIKLYIFPGDHYQTHSKVLAHISAIKINSKLLACTSIATAW